MQDNIVLIAPAFEHEEQARELYVEVSKVDTNENCRFAGFGQLEDYQDRFDVWVHKCAQYAQGKNISPCHVPATTLFAEKDGKIVGIVDIRHKLNDHLLAYGGHIVYTVLPSERRKCYGLQIFLLALQKCVELELKRVLVTCADNNTASYKIIEKAGGMLEDKVVQPDSGVLVRRYWIQTESSCRG